MAYVNIDDKLVPHLEILIDCIKLRGGDLDEQVKRLTSETRLMDNCLEEEILQMKLHAAKVRSEFADTVNEAIQKNTDTWEECVEKIKEKSPKVSELVNIFKPLSQEIEHINKLISNINIYKLEQLIKLAEKIAELDEPTLSLVRKMVSVNQNGEQ